MNRLQDKHIIVGVTGGIAAYKTAELVRSLKKAGSEVRVIMTQGAQEFVTDLTFQALSGQPVYRDLLDTEAEAGMGHIELARWADALIVAPATADFLARLNAGRADDLLTTVALATEAPVAVAPAMNRAMWAKPATQENIAALKDKAIHIWGPASGEQACGEVGEGRMLEPAGLTDQLNTVFASGSLAGLNIIITAGPTWEALDPVRGLSNRSSGKMGYAVAQAALEAGACVTLISGPVSITAPERARLIKVQSAQDMHDAVMQHIADANVFIGVAAVADYRPEAMAVNKIKKDADSLTLKLVRNPDILASVAALKDKPFTIGFAAETTNVENHAREKLTGKKIDLIAANRVGNNEGFDKDDNRLTLIDADGIVELPQQSKAQLARKLITHIARKYYAHSTIKNSRQTHWQ